MTFNLRFDNPRDGENQWKYRKENVASIINFYDVDVCGMQEVLKSQIEDLEHLLPNYEWVGVGRDNGKDKGEFSCIFYNKERVKLLKTKTFWLSETPEKTDKGWDANLPRIVTWAFFKSKKTRKEFYVFNTHFDHMGVVARRESAKLLLEKVKEIAKNAPAIITGDFNATPSDEPIRILTDERNPDFLKDTELLSETPHFGPYSTFNGFTEKEQEGRHIDYIFIKNYNFKVKKHATLSPTWAGKFASDHHAVFSVLEF